MQAQRQIGYWVMFLWQLTHIYGERLSRKNYIFTGMTSKLLFTNFRCKFDVLYQQQKHQL